MKPPCLDCNGVSPSQTDQIQLTQDLCRDLETCIDEIYASGVRWGGKYYRFRNRLMSAWYHLLDTCPVFHVSSTRSQSVSEGSLSIDRTLCPTFIFRLVFRLSQALRSDRPGVTDMNDLKPFNWISFLKKRLTWLEVELPFIPRYSSCICSKHHECLHNSGATSKFVNIV